MSLAQAATNATQLLKNAEVFYRNANKLFGSLGQDGQDDRDVAGFRGSVVGILQRISEAAGVNSSTGAPHGDVREILRNATKARNDAWRSDQLQEMIDEGLARPEIFGMP